MSHYEDNLQERISLINQAVGYLKTRWEEIQNILAAPNLSPAMRKALEQELGEIRKAVELLRSEFLSS